MEDKLLYQFDKFKIYKCLSCNMEEDVGMPCGRIELHDNEGWLPYFETSPYSDCLKEILNLAKALEKLANYMTELPQSDYDGACPNTHADICDTMPWCDWKNPDTCNDECGHGGNCHEDGCCTGDPKECWMKWARDEDN